MLKRLILEGFPALAGGMVEPKMVKPDPDVCQSKCEEPFVSISPCCRQLQNLELR